MIGERVSGHIFAYKNSYSDCGESYFINRLTGNDWHLPVDCIEPDDLRALADRLESNRAERSK